MKPPPNDKSIALFGYSGHAYVAIDIFRSSNEKVGGYLTAKPTITNPYQLDYWGFEANATDLEKIAGQPYFIAVGSNRVRKKITNIAFKYFQYPPISAIHVSSFISETASIGNGVMLGNKTTVNALARIGEGVICNTGAIIEHECIIGNYAHIAPGVVLCGNVKVGENTLIGAGSVVIPGINIGKNVTVGAGTIVTKNIPDNSKIVGNPQRFI